MKVHVSVDAERIVAEIGAGRRGIVPGWLADDAGVDVVELRNLRRQRGVLVNLARGVDRLRDHPFPWDSQCQAALDIAGRDAVLGRKSAAKVHGFWAYKDCDDIEVLVRRGGDHRTPIGIITQSRWLPDAHVTVVDGFPVTTPARTFFDLCASPPPGLRVNHPAHEREMARVYNDALARRGVTFIQQTAVLLVMAKRGRAGTCLLRRLLEKYGPEYTPTQSDAESLFAELIEAYGVPEPERQVPIIGPDGWIGTVDFYWRAARLIVEIDSVWHDGPVDKKEDRERDARLKAAGYTVVRYRFVHLVRRPAAIARELVVAIGNSRRR